MHCRENVLIALDCSELKEPEFGVLLLERRSGSWEPGIDLPSMDSEIRRTYNCTLIHYFVSFVPTYIITRVRWSQNRPSYPSPARNLVRLTCDLAADQGGPAHVSPDAVRMRAEPRMQ
jgi:hypothetical protein